MITKKRLLGGLNELVYLEEGMMGLFANFSKVLLKHTPELDKPKKKKMEKLLSVLYHDSSRHHKMIDSMIKNVLQGMFV